MKSLLKSRGKYNRLNIELLVIVHLLNETRKHTKALFQYKFSIQILKYPSYLPKKCIYKSEIDVNIISSYVYLREFYSSYGRDHR